MLLVCFLLHQVRFRSSVSEPDLVYSGRSCSWIITGSGWQDHLANLLAGAVSAARGCAGHGAVPTLGQICAFGRAGRAVYGASACLQAPPAIGKCVAHATPI
ncbi:hypothetical protein ZIOFF_044544 [Zingiber officinale]|uniref:Secreted protein n=1 Tax=Zingiber officinale TaxID=94328 RepID=A0A8J5KUJ2_ZINOF|nr:hypothetical protein ZIOFF_044544 [Zingiber officinale]